jgi:hypothetical protein
MFKRIYTTWGIIISVMAAILAIGCGSNAASPASSEGNISGKPTIPTSNLTIDDEAAIYAAVIRQLATVDDTFGGNLKPPKLFIVNNTDNRAGNPEALIPQTTQNEITQTLRDLPSIIIWIDKLEDAEFEGGWGTGEVKDGAIIALGVIYLQNDGSTRLAGSIYMSGTAAGGATYVLGKKDGVWEIKGTTGNRWIS